MKRLNPRLDSGRTSVGIPGFRTYKVSILNGVHIVDTYVYRTIRQKFNIDPIRIKSPKRRPFIFDLSPITCNVHRNVRVMFT